MLTQSIKSELVEIIVNLFRSLPYTLISLKTICSQLKCFCLVLLDIDCNMFVCEAQTVFKSIIGTTYPVSFFDLVRLVRKSLQTQLKTEGGS